MKRTLPLLTAFVLVLVAGLVHGLSTGRWRTSHRLEEAVARLARVPQTIGAWHGQDGTMSDEEKRVAGIEGAVVRRYTNEATKESVSIMLICGPQGPISVHPPEVCFAGAGFEFETEPAHYSAQVPGLANPVDFKTARLNKKHRGVLMHMDLFWAWNADGTWTAPQEPRLHFAGQDALYKLYVYHVHSATEAASDQHVCQEFLGVLLPKLHEALFAK
ncbi:MAG TPA: exosortase-associated EpsI family protein [Gemmataceae bacterium]|nr:exosortase-associated EpsI family protein [Gemmataceae bacterium]